MVWYNDTEKIPGLVSFKPAFFKVCWNIVKGYVLRFVNDFVVKSSVPKVGITSFLALIPKVDNPQTLEEYNPILLVGRLYRILSKMFLFRLIRLWRS